jgi:hypothetical protein
VEIPYIRDSQGIEQYTKLLEGPTVMHLVNYMFLVQNMQWLMVIYGRRLDQDAEFVLKVTNNTTLEHLQTLSVRIQTSKFGVQDLDPRCKTIHGSAILRKPQRATQNP